MYKNVIFYQRSHVCTEPIGDDEGNMIRNFEGGLGGPLILKDDNDR